jgi:hypothetical protein
MVLWFLREERRRNIIIEAELERARQMYDANLAAYTRELLMYGSRIDNAKHTLDSIEKGNI